MIILDTNVISEIRKRERAHSNVVKWVAQTPVKDIGTSVVVLAEIRRGPLAVDDMQFLRGFGTMVHGRKQGK